HTKEIEGNAINSEWGDTLIDLSNNTNCLFEIMDQHKKVSSDTLDLLEVVCKKLENLEALAVYRDFISLLVLEVQQRLGNKVWVAVSIAIHRKRNYKKVDFRKFEKDNILKLKKVLSDVDISVEEFELLIALKDESNCEFHKCEDQDRKKLNNNSKRHFLESYKDSKTP
ncbi:7244_t:CDS:1, partial [Funneliformis geosporum]